MLELIHFLTKINIQENKFQYETFDYHNFIG